MFASVPHAMSLMAPAVTFAEYAYPRIMRAARRLTFYIGAIVARAEQRLRRASREAGEENGLEEERAGRPAAEDGESHLRGEGTYSQRTR